jgi:hypothetical protein
MYLPGTPTRHLPGTAVRRPAQRSAAPASTTPPLTVEWLVARDIDAYSARRRTRPRAAATMDAQASTRPSPVSLRKNGTSAVAQA